MSLKVKHLIEKLKEKDPEKEVEFMIIGVDNTVVCLDVESSAHGMVDLLKMFKKVN